MSTASAKPNTKAKKALCPALFFCAPASGQGKTTITAGIARYHRQQGRDVRVFKTGPDYLDPLILEQASGQPVTQLDLWMVGEEACKRILYEAACEADLILIEGVMGMFDGAPSGADMAQFFGIPIAIIIHAGSMAQTFAALVQGLVKFRPELKIAGVIANAVGSTRHEDLIRESMLKPSVADLPLLGCLRRNADIALPERHLGLVQPGEVIDMDARLDAVAVAIEQASLHTLPEPVEFMQGQTPTTPPPLLKGLDIAIARDEAFSFIYAANVKLLEDMGAKCLFFSPLHDEHLPFCDALWLPGGYPELHHKKLAENFSMQESIAKFHARGKKILAECGGMLYLMENLTDVSGQREALLGLLPGDGIMRERGGCQGMQYAPMPEGELRAHAHHRTCCEGTLEPIAHGRRLRHPAPGEPIYRENGITASYLHLYFASNPEATAALFS